MRASHAGVYIDTCLLGSLFHGDSGYTAAEAWLAGAKGEPLWISHWVLLECASATVVRLRRGELGSEKAQVIRATLELFCRERLGMLEPRGEDFLLARRWLQEEPSSGLRGADARHLAIAHRHGLPLVTADQALVSAARALDLQSRLVN